MDIQKIAFHEAPLVEYPLSFIILSFDKISKLDLYFSTTTLFFYPNRKFIFLPQ